MEVIEKSAEGLDRRFTVKVAKDELDARLVKRLEGMKDRVQIKGFRKGKAPVSFLRKMYGKGVMGEIVNEVVAGCRLRSVKALRAVSATEPHPHFTGDIDAVIEGRADLEYDVHGEILPTFEPMDVAGISLKRPVAEVPEEDVEASLKSLADQQKTYAPRAANAKSKDGDMLVIDYVGSADGEEFEGGKGEGQEILLGSGRFIPGFEEQLVGVKAGEEKTVNVTFPEAYGSAKLAGKAAQFAVTVKEVKAPEEVAIDDELAKKIGFDDLGALRQRLKERLEREFAALSRQHMKRALLDKLDTAHSFELPPTMVKQEFEQIWAQVENSERDEEDKDKTEDELKAEYRKIAERRVRLGLVLAEIGRRAEVQVPTDQLQRAVQEQAIREARMLQAQGRDITPQQVLQFYQQNPQAIAQIRAPLFEECVVDYIFERASVADQKVSKEDLLKDPEGEAAE